MKFPLKGVPFRQWLMTTEVIAATIFLCGCLTPAQRVDLAATRFGYSSHVAESKTFKHRIYRNRHGMSSAADTLHVYLEGDGTPWINNHDKIAADPTPRLPLMLELMALDRQPAVYLGRPCYHGYAGTPACSPALWTYARYSEEVVDSMAQVIREQLRQAGVDRLVLFGHSGGGVLAVLLAARLPQTRGVITVGANIDIDAWADLHDYSRLQGSLNPLNEPPLHTSIAQLHMIGGRDTNVPAALLHPYASRQADAQVVVLPDYDHVCCWRDLWLQILAWTRTIDRLPAGHRATRFLNH